MPGGAAQAIAAQAPWPIRVVILTRDLYVFMAQSLACWPVTKEVNCILVYLSISEYLLSIVYSCSVLVDSNLGSNRFLK